MRNIHQVDKLVALYERSRAKNPRDEFRPVQTNKNDYIKEPKPDGYRSVHLIYKYQAPPRKRVSLKAKESEIR